MNTPPRLCTPFDLGNVPLPIRIVISPMCQYSAVDGSASDWHQIPFAAQMKRALRIPIIGVGLITEPAQADNIIAQGQADLVALARGFLHDPRWPWRAAAQLGASVAAPVQYLRALPRGHPALFAETALSKT